MKRFSFLPIALLVASLALMFASVQARSRTSVHKATYEIVSIDTENSTITLKDEKGVETKSPVLPVAAEQLATLKAGLKVIVSCQDNDDGEHEGIVAFEIVKPSEPDSEAKTYHQETYEVVAVDVKSRTITLKVEDGDEFTTPVMGKAILKLEDLTPGMKVLTRCQDNKQGEHEGIVEIEIVG